MHPQIGDRIAFRLMDGSGIEHEGTVTELFLDPSHGAYVSTDHLTDLAVTAAEIVRVITPAGAS